MSAMRDPVGAAPDMRRMQFLWLLFACVAAPLFWLGQVILGYGVTSLVCYPGDHPDYLAESSGLFVWLMIFNGVALAGCVGGALLSWRAWRRMGALEGYGRFLTVWALMSTLWFFAAILNNILASIMVPACRG